MAMKDGAGTPLDPANLWGKPDPRARPAKEEKVSRKMDEDQLDDDDIDVDAELDRAEEESELEVVVDDEAPEDSAEDFETEDGEEIADEVDEELEEEEIVAESEEELEEEEVAAEADDELADEYSDADDTETAESLADEAEFDDDNPAADEEETPAATSRKRNMAEKKTSLSDHIRAEISRRKASGDSLRGKDIVEALASRRIKVSPAQVSQIMKKEGLSGGKPGRPKASAAASTEERSRSALKVHTKRPPAKPSIISKTPAAKVRPSREAGEVTFGLPMAQLKAAETFVAACGSLKNAERILTLAASLSNQFDG